MDLEADIRAQNASLLVHVDRLAQLELDRADDRNVLQSQDSRLSFVETNIMSLNVTLQNHSSRIEELDSGTTCNQNIIANHTVRLSQLEVLVDETRNKLLDYGTKLTKQTGNKPLVNIADKDKQLKQTPLKSLFLTKR